MPSWNTAVGRMRMVGMLEGVSFLVLMGVAVPLKYLAGMPAAVKWPGLIHGVLFVIYCLTILIAFLEGRIPIRKAGIAFVASLFPFGPFVIDRKLAEDESLEKSSS